MQTASIIAQLGGLEDACGKLCEKFQIDGGPIDKLLAGVANLKKNQDAFIPQIAFCGDQGAGKTTLIKHLFFELWPEIVKLPGGPTGSIPAPMVIRFEPKDPGAHGSTAAQYQTNYFTREEYVDTVLWTLDNLLDEADAKAQQAIVEANASRTLEDIRKACEAALAVAGGDKPALRKHFRLIEEDCRDPQKLEDAFASLKQQNYVKRRNDAASLRGADIDPLSGLVKAVTITAPVEANAIPCPFQVIDLPGFRSDGVLALHYGTNYAQRYADAFVACIASADQSMDEEGVRYFSKLIGRDSFSSSRARVIYALTKAIAPNDDKSDVRFSETLLENLISTHHWTEPGFSPSGQPGVANVFVVDGLAGVLHSMRSASDLSKTARENLGLASDGEYKSIKKRWNSGRVGQDNQTLKLAILKFLTYTMPKENFHAVKSAANDLVAKYKSIVAGVKPEQSSSHAHALAGLQQDARARFDECAASVESQLDVLHRTLRHDIIAKLNATLAVGNGGDVSADALQPAPAAAEPVRPAAAAQK